METVALMTVSLIALRRSLRGGFGPNDRQAGNEQLAAVCRVLERFGLCAPGHLVTQDKWLDLVYP